MFQNNFITYGAELYDTYLPYNLLRYMINPTQGMCYIKQPEPKSFNIL